MDSIADDLREILLTWGYFGRLLLLALNHRATLLPYWPLIVPLVTLSVVLLLRNGFFWNYLPNLRDSVRHLTDQRNPRLPEIYEEVLQRLQIGSSVLRRGVAKTDDVLRRLYGPTPFGPLTFDRALSIAALYPICSLLGVWLICGTGSLGSTELLSPLPLGTRIELIVATIGVALAATMFFRFSHNRAKVKNRCEGTWTRTGYRFPDETFFGNLRRDMCLPLRHDTHSNNPWTEALILLVVAFLVFLFFMAEREPSLITDSFRDFWTRKSPVGGTNVTAGSLLNTSIFAAALALTIAYFISGMLAGLIILLGSVLTILAVLPADQHALCTAAVWATFCVCCILYQTLINSRGGRMLVNVSRVTICMLLVALLPLTASALPHIYKLSEVPSVTWNADRPAFDLVLFTGLVPIYNAILDYLSVAITRTCIAAYLKGSIGWVRFWAVDVGSAIVLVVLACAGTLHLTRLMFELGWNVDADGIKAQFASDPWQAQTLWITLSGITNLLPTLLHLVLLLWGLLTAVLLRDSRVVGRLHESLKSGKALHPVDARALVRYLVLDRYLALTFVIVTTACGIYVAVPRLLHLLVS